MPKTKTVEDFFENLSQWKRELAHIRGLISKTEMEATLKWGVPVYTINGKNVVGLTGFKNHFGVWFYNGALLNDPNGYLHNAQEGKTKALRQLRYTSFEEIDDEVIMNFLHQAIENQKAGKEVKIDLNREADIPPLLEGAFSENKEIRAKFEELTPGRQREYAHYITDAKQEGTKKRRLKKIIPMILKGVGLNDKYQK